MIHDDACNADDPIRTDVCIVGGGPAGISLALRLAERSDLGICLLESGGEAYEPEAQDLAAGTTDGMPLPPLGESVIRALGGSTWSYGGVVGPLDETAFERRWWVTTAGWPVDRGAIDRYEADAMAMFGIDRSARRADVAASVHIFEEAGFGEGVEPVPLSFTRPTRFGPTYEPRLAESPDIDVYLHTTVVDLETRDRRVVAAVAASRERDVRVEADTFVLASGGIGNPRLLLATGLGGPAVGRFLMDHPRFAERYRIGRGTRLRALLAPWVRRPMHFYRVGLPAWTQRREQLLAWHANLSFGYLGQGSPTWLATRRLALANSAPWRESPFFQDAGGGRLGTRLADVTSALRRPDLAVLGALGSLGRQRALLRHLDVVGSTEQVPDPENRVELMDERDATGLPRAKVVLRVGPAEERTAARGHTVLLEALDRIDPGLSSRRMNPAEDGIEPVMTSWHHLGSTRMAADASHGVVDADCRVHGLHNLFVTGGSVFPTAGSASPTLTIVELALRLADHLAGGRVAPGVSMGSDDHAPA